MAGCRRYNGPRRGGQLGGKGGRLCSVDQLQASRPANLLEESSETYVVHCYCNRSMCPLYRVHLDRIGAEARLWRKVGPQSFILGKAESGENKGKPLSRSGGFESDFPREG
jgi:hypothetical protein